MLNAPTHTTATIAAAGPAAAASGSRIPAHWRRALRATAHLLLDLPIGVAGFTLIVTGLATGASLAITLAGLPLLAGVLVAARHAGRFERARARALLGVSVAAPAPRPRAATITGRILDPLRDRAAWRASGYLLLLLPVGTLTFTAAVTWWGTALFLLMLPAWAWALPHGGPDIGYGYWSTVPELAASSVAGALMVAAAPFVIHAIAGADRGLLRLLAGR